MSWAAHEFENYLIQRHVGVKASFLALVAGAMLPDVFTKALVYGSDEAAAFHRGWPGVGFTHSLIFGAVIAVVVLAVTRSRAWAFGLLLGQWAHVITDVADSAGVMLFFPFSTEPVALGLWKHAASLGRHGDAVAYYSTLGGVWDLFWLCLTVVFASRVLRRSYFQDVVVPADPVVWGWISRSFRLPDHALLLLYRGFLFYGVGRMLSWFLYARLAVKTPFEPVWGGPSYLVGDDLSDAGFVEVAIRTGIGGVLFAFSLWLCWRLFIRRLWARGHDTDSARQPTAHARVAA